jgi:arsenate reductase
MISYDFYLEGGKKGEVKTEKKKVLFLCTHNSARSQIAEGLLINPHKDYYEIMR